MCKRMGVEIIEAECYKDHIHMFIRILSPQYSISCVMGVLKRKSRRIILERYINLKYRYEKFWCGGHYVDTVRKNKKKIQEYIQNQLKED